MDLRPGIIASKQQFYELSRHGLAGNRLEFWSGQEFLASPPPARGRTFCLRSLQLSWDRVRYRMPLQDVLRRLKRMSPEELSQIVVSEMAPDERLLLQGEIMRSERGLLLLYNRTPGLSMREALPGMETACGLAARLMVEQALDWPSREFLWEALDCWDGAVVEFTAYGCRLGSHGWNTVFWEIRHY